MNQLLTKSLEVGDVHLLFSFPKELLSPHEKKLVTFISDYIAKYGVPPKVERLGEVFETFIPSSSEDPLGDIYDRTLTKKRNVFAREYLMSVQDSWKKGVDPLEDVQKLHEILAGGASGITRYSTYDRSAYYRRPTSFPYEIPQLDRNTGGIVQGDLVYLIGRLGTGKTTFALWVLTKWLQRGRRILMVSNENRADDVVAKIDSYIGGFNPINKRTVGWSEDDMRRLEAVSYIAKHMEGEVFIPNRPVQDTKELTSLIYTYKPDLVMVDGIYLMNGASGDTQWEKITSISRELKRIAQGEGCPVMGIHQANRNAIGKRIEVEHVAYADALAQDGDLLLGINPEEDGSIFVEAIKNRWGYKSGWGFFVKFFFESMTVRVLDPLTETEE